MAELFKRLTILAMISFALITVINLAVDNPYTHRLIRSALNTKIQEKTGLILDFEAMQLSVVPLGIDLFGFSIRSADGEKAVITQASQLRTRISWFSLFLGQPRVSLIEASELEMNWPPPVDLDKLITNFSSPKKKSTGAVNWPPNFEFPIEKIRVVNGKFGVSIASSEEIPSKDAEKIPDMFLAGAIGVDLELEVDGWQSIDLLLKIRTVDIAASSRSIIENGSLDLRVALRDEIIRGGSLSVKSERMNLDFNLLGNLEVNDDKELKFVHLKSESAGYADLSLLDIAIDEGNTRGRTDVKATLNFDLPIDNLADTKFLIAGDAKITDGYLANFKVFNSQAKFAVDRDKVTLDDIKVIVEDRIVGLARGVIHLNDANDVEFHAKPYDLHFLELFEALDVPVDIIDFVMRSEEFTIAGRGSPLSLKISGLAEIFNLKLPILDVKNQYKIVPYCHVNAQVHVTSDAVKFDQTRADCYTEEFKSANKEAPWKFLTSPGSSPSTLTLTGGVDIKRDPAVTNLTFTGQNFDLAVLDSLVDLPFSGRAEVSAHVVSAKDGPIVDIKAKAENVQLAGIDTKLAVVTGQIKGDYLTWKDAKFSLPNQGVILSETGRLTIDRSLPIKAEVKGTDVDTITLGQIIKVIVPDAIVNFGLSEFNANIEQGKLTEPLALIGQAKFEMVNFTYENEKLFDRLKTSIDLNKKGITSDFFALQLGDTKIYGDLAVEHNAKGKAKDYNQTLVKLGLIPTDTIALNFSTKDPKGNPVTCGNDFVTVPFVNEILQKADLSGCIEAQGKLEGDLDHLEGNFNGKIRQISVLGSVISPVNFKGIVQGQKLDLNFNQSGNALMGKASIDMLSDNIDYNWYMTMKQFDVRFLGPQIFATDPRNFAYLTGSWQMQGQFKEFFHSKGLLEVDKIAAKFQREINSQSKFIEFASTNPFSVLMSSSGWNHKPGSKTTISGKNIAMDISFVNNLFPDKLGVELDGQMNISLIKEFIESIEIASGDISLKGKINGSLAEPVVDLIITNANKPDADEKSNLTLGLLDFRPPFREIKGEVHITNKFIEFKKLQALKGNGKVNVEGTLVTDGSENKNSNLEIQFRNASAVLPLSVFLFDASANGNLVLTGQKPPYNLAGDIEVLKARSSRDFDIRNEIVNAALRRQNLTSNVKQGESLFNFNISLTAENSVHVSSRSLTASLSTNLMIKGDDQFPSLLGQIDVDSGSFNYRRDFEITRGNLTYDNPTVLDPYIDVTAQSEIDRRRIFINISGRVSDPKVEFSVDPPLRDDGTPISKVDILVLLQSGRLPESSRGIGQTQNSASSEALNLLVGQFEEPVQKLFDLSGQDIVREVYIDTYPSEPDGTPVPRFNVPLNVSRNLDLKLTYDQVGNWRVSSEIPLHDSISLFGGIDGQRKEDTQVDAPRAPADTGVDMRFKFAFP